MNAYDRQLTAAIDQIAESNPYFDFAAADQSTQARQLKTWCGKAISDDHAEGHDPSGPVTASLSDLSDQRLVLLSCLQRGLRGKPGDWTATAAADVEEALTVAVAGHGITITATVSEGRSGIAFRNGITAVDTDGRNPVWPDSLSYRSTHLDAPAADLLDLLALSAAFAASPFSAHAKSFTRTGRDSLDVIGMAIALDWREVTVDPAEGVRGFLSSTSGISEDDVEGALIEVLRDALAKGHSVPPAPSLPPVVETPEAPMAEAGESNAARRWLEDMGINVGNAQVIGVGPGSSVSIGVGFGPDGLSVTGIPPAGAPAAPAVPDEDSFMAECAKSLGIPLDVFRGIIEEED